MKETNSDVEIIRTHDGKTIVAFKRIFGIAFQMPKDYSDVCKFIEEARPVAEQAFKKIAE